MVPDHFGTGWSIVRRDLLAWVTLTVAFAVLVPVTCGLGLLLAPNLLRATARALEEDRAPSVRDLLTLRHLVDDLVLLFVVVVAGALGQVVPVLGSVAVATLMIWLPMLVVDGHYAPLQAAIVSAVASVDDLRSTLPFQVLGMLAVGIATVTCGVPVLVVLPVVLAASWTFYQARRSDLLETGDRLGLRRRG